MRRTSVWLGVPLCTVLCAALLTACGDTAGDDPGAVAVDSAFVDVLADLHLADARAALAPDTLRRPAIAESLRAVALQAHRLRARDVDARLGDWASDPAVAVAHYDALDARLSAERVAGATTLPTRPLADP